MYFAKDEFDAELLGGGPQLKPVLGARAKKRLRQLREAQAGTDPELGRVRPSVAERIAYSAPPPPVTMASLSWKDFIRLSSRRRFSSARVMCLIGDALQLAP